VAHIAQRNGRASLGLMKPPRQVLVVDVGGSNVKLAATGQDERLKLRSGRKLTAGLMIAGVRELAEDWTYDAISLGYPGQVNENGPIADNEALGQGWVGFDFGGAFGKPVRIINDAAMQALGSYEGGAAACCSWASALVWDPPSSPAIAQEHGEWSESCASGLCGADGCRPCHKEPSVVLTAGVPTR
jgi:hypothetical protein